MDSFSYSGHLVLCYFSVLTKFTLCQVNDKTGQFADVLRGVSLGGVGLDACSSDIRSGFLVSNINNGLFTLARDGEYITPQDIETYIGAYSSKSSIYLARILTDIGVPQVSIDLE